jgi:hypothetical protein
MFVLLLCFRIKVVMRVNVFTAISMSVFLGLYRIYHLYFGSGDRNK